MRANSKTLPTHWDVIKLGTYVEKEKGKKPRNQSASQSEAYVLPYIDIEAFEQGIIKSWTDGKGCRICKASDLLMVWDGSRSGLVGRGMDGALGSTLMRINFPNINNQYAFYFLLSKYQEINTRAKGSGTPHVDPDLLWNYDFPIPPSDEQTLIVAKIEELFSELDSGIASLKTAQEQLKIYRQSLLKHAFEGKLTEQWRKDNADKLETPEQLLARIQTERETRYQQQLDEWKQAVKAWEAKGKKPSKPQKFNSFESTFDSEVQALPTVPKNWCFTTLGEFIDQITAGKSFKCEEREPSNDEIGVAKVSAVTWGEYNEAESKTCTDPTKINSDYFIKTDDFIFSRANTIELVGACVIAKKVTKKIMLSDKTLRINFMDINKLYVLHYLRSHFGRKEIMERSTGNQESMRNIGQERIKSIVIPICSLDEQQEIVNQLEEKLSIIEQNEKEIESALAKAELLRQSILKKAFSGQLFC